MSADEDEVDGGDYELVRSPFPMVRKLQRRLGEADAGPAFIWDIDKTWLDTRFSQLKGMLKIPFEFAVDKQALPGTTALLHALRQGPSEREHRPLYFITASPPFIRKAIERKMLIDGIEFDGITYKDQVEVFRRREFGSLKEHTAFKLGALLLLAREFPAGPRVYMFGDDAEGDPLLYCMFADVCAGRLRGERLVRAQMQLGALQHYAEEVASLAEEVDPHPLVARIHIHLVREPDGGRIRRYGPHVVGYPSAGAVARLLCDDGLISPRGRERVVGEGEVVPGQAAPDPEGWWTPGEDRAS